VEEAMKAVSAGVVECVAELVPVADLLPQRIIAHQGMRGKIANPADGVAGEDETILWAVAEPKSAAEVDEK
jgi:hypothetical protein